MRAAWVMRHTPPSMPQFQPWPCGSSIIARGRSGAPGVSFVVADRRAVDRAIATLTVGVAVWPRLSRLSSGTVVSDEAYAAIHPYCCRYEP